LEYVVPMDPPSWLHVHPEVAAALASGRPVVALESTVITHGLPEPVNLELARRMEAEVRSAGAVPATVAVIDGRVCLGVTTDELERLALSRSLMKISRRDLGTAVAQRATGGTTVAATMIAAHAGGVQVFATGGIGGVHHGTSGDISADLPELARTPVAVVCAGAKAILDLPRTLEWLETAGVPVLGWGTDEFPAFFTRSSGLPVSAKVKNAAETVALIRTHWAMGLRSGVLVCVPCPEEVAVPAEKGEAVLRMALQQAESEGVRGKQVTPYLLARLADLSGGGTLRANLALLRNNARVAAEIARAFA
jgi:pseudouridine-5'-phosphate glycosidase